MSGATVEATGVEGQIEAVGLSAYCGAAKVLDDVNMVIAPRTVTTLFGPAGAGKSTLLRTINRTHELVPGGRVAGTLTVGGVDVYASDVDVVALRTPSWDGSVNGLTSCRACPSSRTWC